VRSSIALLLVSLAGILGGAALIGVWALGLAVIADSVAVGVYALLREDSGRAAPSVHEVPTLASILEKARRAG
jgi:hypothetical protein